MPYHASVARDSLADRHLMYWHLATITEFPNSWSLVNLRATVSRLNSFVKHTCYGSATVSYPSLLPLLASLLPEVCGTHFVQHTNRLIDRSLGFRYKQYTVAQAWCTVLRDTEQRLEWIAFARQFQRHQQIDHRYLHGIGGSAVRSTQV
jgi:hypothetical protein